MAIRNQYTDLFDSGYYQDIAKHKADKLGVSPSGSRGENTDFDNKEDEIKRAKLDIKKNFSGSSQSRLEENKEELE